MISFSFLHRDQSKRHNVRKIQNYTLKDLENASLQLQQRQFGLCVPVHPCKHNIISSAGLAFICICIQLSSSQQPKHQKFVEHDTRSTRRFQSWHQIRKFSILTKMQLGNELPATPSEADGSHHLECSFLCTPVTPEITELYRSGREDEWKVRQC